MARSQNARKHRYNEDYFKLIDSCEKAYWLGFIMADGCVYQGSDGKSFRLQINLKADDLEHLEKFQRAIGSDYKIQVKDYKKSRVAILKINSTKMCKDLIEHGVTPRKSLVCQFPKAITHRFYNAFIRGYFDGDGCITCKNEKKWTFGIVGGEDMLLEIQKRLPVETHIYKIKHSEAVSLEVSKHESIHGLFQWLYHAQHDYLERKYLKFIEFETLYMSRLVEMQGQ